ncbi:MAG: DUF2019 domain-containing protein [Bacteroidota bacterium]
MIKIKDIETALVVFEEASIKQAEATEEGDYKTGNKRYSEITKAAEFIKSEDAVESLKQFLSHTSIGVRMWAACYLLPVDEKEGKRVLKEIAKSSGIHALTADTTLSEWKKGNLKF